MLGSRRGLPRAPNHRRTWFAPSTKPQTHVVCPEHQTTDARGLPRAPKVPKVLGSDSNNTCKIQMLRHVDKTESNAMVCELLYMSCAEGMRLQYVRYGCSMFGRCSVKMSAAEAGLLVYRWAEWCPPFVRTHLSVLTTFLICYAICMRNRRIIIGNVVEGSVTCRSCSSTFPIIMQWLKAQLPAGPAAAPRSAGSVRPANTMSRKLLYSGFETCFGPSTQGAGIRYQNTSQIQILRHFEKKGRCKILRF